MLKISIITPSFNQGEYIAKTIDSVLSQNYPNLEYYVVDGGSTDNTVEILKSYGDRIKWVSQIDTGQTNAINWGLKKISGDIISYLNSDDLLLPNSLQVISDTFDSNKCEWLIGDYQIIDSQGRRVKKHAIVEKYKHLLLAHFSRNLLLTVNNFLPQPSTFWSKKAFKKIGLFDESLHYTMDYDYWLRLSKEFKPLIVQREFSQFRLHSQSKSVSGRVKMFEEELRVMEKHRPNLFQRHTHRLHSFVSLFIYRVIG